jgi:hypothetical protein
MLKPLLIFLLVIYAILSHAQVREITGLVTCDNERQSGAIIKNLSLHTQTISNERGEFAIKAKSGDTLITIKEDYIKDTLVVADQQDLIIQLHKPPLVLKEVLINGTAITPASTYEANKKEYKEIYFLGDNKGIFFSGSLVNIDKLNNALGKKGHEARRLQHTLTKDYKNSIVDKRFNLLAARITGYKGKILSDWIMENRPSYEMVIKATDYDLVQYIKGKLSGDKRK